jgi:hypothetical protein
MKAARLLVAAAVAGAAGCVNNDRSISILQVQALTSSSGCVIMGTVSTGLSHGLLDASFGNGYFAGVVVRNNLQTSRQANGVEYNSVEIIGANVTLENPDGSQLAPTFFYASSPGTIDPGVSVGMLVQAIPAAMAGSLVGKTVVSDIKPVGKRSGDQIIGGPVDFPVDVCNGCLHSTAACLLPKGTAVNPTPCFVGQDSAGTCCNDPVNGYVCGSNAVAM